MQNAIQKFRQSSIVFKKPVHVFYLPLSKKRCVGFFFNLDLELFAKIKKNLVSTYSFFTLWLTTPDLKKIKKIPHTFL